MFSEKNHLQFLVGAIFDDSETSFLQFHLHGEMNPSLQSTMAWGLWCHRHSLNTANERGSPLTTPRGPTKHQGVVQDDKMTNPTHTVSVVQKEVWRYCVCMAVIVQITYPGNHPTPIKIQHVLSHHLVCYHFISYLITFFNLPSFPDNFPFKRWWYSQNGEHWFPGFHNSGTCNIIKRWLFEPILLVYQ